MKTVLMNYGIQYDFDTVIDVGWWVGSNAEIY